jgi:hypothetical protein
MVPYPEWLHILAWIYIGISIASASFVLVDTIRHRQKMWIMQPVWVISALYFSILAVYWYVRTRPAMTMGSEEGGNKRKRRRGSESPQPVQVAVAVLHCGAGCTLGDAIAENAVPALGLTFAGTFGSRLIIDFVLAYAFGIVFQYFTVAPVRNLSFGDGIRAAIKADTISISMFELGMFGWMALVYFALFPSPHLHPNAAVFWFMMQIAMIIGWATSYPANVWLIKKGWKEKMPEFVPNETKQQTLQDAA